MSSTKEKDNVIKFKISKKKQRELFDEAYDRGDLYGALAVLNSMRERNAMDNEMYEDFIDLYDEMGAYSCSLNMWFEYICYFGIEENAVEKYEGLAVTYGNLGMDSESIYYYKKLFEVGSFNEINEVLNELDADSFSFNSEDSNLRLVHSSGRSDCSNEFNRGAEALRDGNIESAIEEFSSIDENSNEYVNAQNFLALSHALKGDLESGCKICKELLKKHPADVQTLTTLASLYLELGDKESGREICEQLCKRTDVSAENLYKIATVACESDMPEEAVRMFEKLEGMLPADKNLLYLTAVANYNAGRYSVSGKYFWRLLTLYPNSSVAKYYSGIVSAAEEAERVGAEAEKVEIPYSYHLPEEERRERVNYLNFALKSNDITPADIYFNECLNWAVDEYYGQDEELQCLAYKAAMRSKHDVFLQTVFFRYDLPDYPKTEILRELVELNKPISLRLVLSNIYNEFNFDGIKLGKKDKKIFLKSAAVIIARFAPLMPDKMEVIIDAVERIYNEAYLKRHPDIEIDIRSLECAIFLFSEIPTNDTWMESVRVFKADAAKVILLLDTDDEFYMRIARGGDSTVLKYGYHEEL